VVQYIVVKELADMSSYTHNKQTIETTDGVMLPYDRFAHLHAILA
jgi:hypothetical protein